MYARLAADGESELLHDRTPAAATIRDLGCGAGRLANPLHDLGHSVTGVDDFPQMLAHLDGVVPVLSRIEDLRLGRRFQVVLLASNLINTPERSKRQRIVQVAAEHLVPGGGLLLQWQPPARFDRFPGGS